MQTRRVPRKANNRLPPRKEDRPLLAAAWPAAVLGRALALASGSGGGAAALAGQCRGSVRLPVPRCRRPASCCPPASSCAFSSRLELESCRFRIASSQTPGPRCFESLSRLCRFGGFSLWGFPGRRPRGGGSRARMASLLWGRIVRQRGRNTRCSSGLKGSPPSRGLPVGTALQGPPDPGETGAAAPMELPAEACAPVLGPPAGSRPSARRAKSLRLHQRHSGARLSLAHSRRGSAGRRAIRLQKSQVRCCLLGPLLRATLFGGVPGKRGLYP